MSKTLRYLKDGENFGDHHFKPSFAFTPPGGGESKLAGHTTRFAQGGHVKGATKQLPAAGYAKGGKVKRMAMGGPPMPMGALSGPPAGGPPPGAPVPMPAPGGAPGGAGPIAKAIGTHIGQQAVKAILKHHGKGKKGHGRKPSLAPAGAGALGALSAGPPAPQPAAAPAAPMGVKKGGHITAAQRKALPASDFALGKGHYPIDTKGRARDALSRGAANASPAQQSKIKAKVKAKYPEMQVSHNRHGGRVLHMRKGGHIPDMDGDEAQDKAMVTKGVHEHEGNMHKGKPKTHLKLAKGGSIGKGMPINRPPADPATRRTPHNITPGGVVPYGVQPSHESGGQPITQMRGGGRVRY